MSAQSAIKIKSIVWIEPIKYADLVDKNLSMRVINLPAGHSDTWQERLIAKQWMEDQARNPDLAGRRIEFESFTYQPVTYDWLIIVIVSTDPLGTKLPEFIDRIKFIVKRKVTDA